MKYWITSDTHFGHEKMKEYCNRPDNFEELIFKNFKSVVSEDDVLIHLGDVAFRKHEYWTQRFCYEIPGKKWLCVGNHDKKSVGWFLSRGFDMACHNFSLKYANEKILFSHEPLPEPLRHGLDFSMNIHGHQHDKGDNSKTGFYRLMSLEFAEYKPILLEQII